MRKLTFPLIIAIAFAAAALFPSWAPENGPTSTERTQTLRSVAGLPPEALETFERIQGGGPFPYRQDGTTFHNRERLLPAQPRGYYREYTVATPGARNRGARRFVVGGDPPEVFYYTEDHYRSFRRIEVAQ